MDALASPKIQRIKKAKKQTCVDDQEEPGCLALLKKISCSLQCGGTSCSIRETEQISPSSLSDSSSESLASVEPTKAAVRKRRSSSKPPVTSMAMEGLAPVKRARRTAKKPVADKPLTESLVQGHSTK